MHQKSFFLQRFRSTANPQQFRLFWGLRFMLAFLLLLLALSQAGSSPLAVKAIALLSLALFGLICFLDVKKESNMVEQTSKQTAIRQQKAVQSYLPQLNADEQSVTKKFHSFRIHSVVFEVNKLVEQYKLSRKTIDFFVLPNTDGSRYSSRAIARLKSAGYAIRPHSELPPFENITETDASLIGVHDGCVCVLIGNR